MSDIITDHDLQKECEAIAGDILADVVAYMASDETPDHYQDDMSDQAHERADGHQWVIYHHHALQICAHCDTDNGEALVDDIGLPKPFSLSSLASLVAYGEIRARVEAALSDLVAEWEDTRT
jgi:hypothetical protein